MTAPKPRQFGVWTTLARVGDGAFGVTWRCHHKDDIHDLAAVKVLREEHCSHDGYLERFRAECDLLRLLNERPHIHLAAFRGVGPNDEAPTWVATEYIPGLNLETCLDRGQHPYPWPLGPSVVDRYRLALMVGRAVASATAHTHARGIVHRDIKPSNIMMSEDGRIVLVDFGIGHDARVARLTSSLTPSPHTAAFAAPEILRGEAVEDAWLNRLDVYSLGVVLHEILSGDVAHIPFVIDESGQSNPRPRTEPLELGSQYPEPLQALVRAMTGVLPWSRPDMAAVHAQLHNMPGSLASQPSPMASMPPSIESGSSPRETWAPHHQASPITPTEGSTSNDRLDVEALIQEPAQPSRRGWLALCVAVLTLAGTVFWQLSSHPSDAEPLGCGDGILSAGETCDDGNRVDGDGCDFLCRMERCGDGKLQGIEACDDGNNNAGDGCAPDCTLESARHACPAGTSWLDGQCTPDSRDGANHCGNGHIDPSEDCDDGNQDPNDGCSAQCTYEDVFPPPTAEALHAWSERADRADMNTLLEHIRLASGWLPQLKTREVVALVHASIRTGVTPETPPQGAAELLGPTLSTTRGTLTCADARVWLSWTGHRRDESPDVWPFYKRWCEICTVRKPALAVTRSACRKRRGDGYIYTHGICIHQDNIPYIQGCED